MSSPDRDMLETREAELSQNLWARRDDKGSEDVLAVQAEILAVRNDLAAIYRTLPAVVPDTDRAREIARIVHECQTDKAGKAYIYHPGRVARHTDGTPDQVATAWLHDVLEDGPFNSHEFRYGMARIAAEVSPQVAVAVHLLTKYPQDKVDNLLSYYCLIRDHELARAVKLADIRDNTDPTRMMLLDPLTRVRLTAKYCRALTLLYGEPGGVCAELAPDPCV